MTSTDPSEWRKPTSAGGEYGPPQGPPMWATRPERYGERQPYAEHLYGQVPAAPKKRKRIFMWFFLVVQVLFLIWVIAGAHAGHTANHCGADTDCQNATDTGAAIGVALVVVLWAVVDVILGFTFLVLALSRRSR